MSTVNLNDVPDQLEDSAAVLGAALATWSTRDDSKVKPGVRQAANDAMDMVDAMLGVLHATRLALTDEIREADDAAAARRATVSR